MRFPKDSLKHKAVVEWWYFNGNLKDAKGKKYAFMNCLFKVNPKKCGISFLSKIPLKKLYFSHHLLSDIGHKRFISRIHPISLISKDSFSKKLLFVDYIHPSFTGYVSHEILEEKPFCYKIKTEDFDFILKSKKMPLFHNKKGEFFFDKRKVGYYSLSNLDIKGTINLRGRKIPVNGKGWMDHEWAGAIRQKDKTDWNWFSIQLDDNTELMLQEYVGKYRYAGILNKNGKADFCRDLILIPHREWKSKKTGAKYPVEWKVFVPSKKIELQVKPFVEHQEMIFGNINYWEGPISVSGKIGKKKVKGKGFMELVGRKMHKSAVRVYEEATLKELHKYWRWGKKKTVSYLKEKLRKR